jgi:hypothetical protein
MLNYLEQLASVKEIKGFEKNLSAFFLKIYQVFNSISEINEIILIVQLCTLNAKQDISFYLSDEMKVGDEMFYRSFNHALNEYVIKDNHNKTHKNIDLLPNSLNLHSLNQVFDYFSEFEPKNNLLTTEQKPSIKHFTPNAFVFSNTLGIEDLPIKLTYDNVLNQLEEFLDIYCPHLRQILEKEMLENNLNDKLTLSHTNHVIETKLIKI